MTLVKKSDFNNIAQPDKAREGREGEKGEENIFLLGYFGNRIRLLYANYLTN